jgi:hypothetical protein
MHVNVCLSLSLSLCVWCVRGFVYVYVRTYVRMYGVYVRVQWPEGLDK